jgi:hypothetical protein
MDNRVLTLRQAISLMDHLNPNEWALQASETGIVIYPRKQIHGLTAWEKSLSTAALPIPQDWIGYLSHSDHQTHGKWRKFSSTSSHSQSLSQTKQNLSQEVAGDSSLNQLLALMQAYLSVGRPMEVKSMEDVCRSICKEISGSY